MEISHREETHLRTSDGLSVTDITDEVRDAVLKLGITDGICCIYSPHMSCTVRVNEWERGFFEDFGVMLKRLMPSDLYHGDWDRHTERIQDEKSTALASGESHRISMLLGPRGECVPVRGGELCLGDWQRIVLLELDCEHEGGWLVNFVGA